MAAIIGCSKKEESSAAKKYFIGVLSKDQSNTFVRNISDAIIARAAELSDECTVTILDAEGAINKQIQQAEDLITQRVDALILFAVDYEGSAPIVDMALDAGIKVIGLNSITSNTDKITYVGSDDLESGKLQGEWLKTVLKPGSKVVYLMGDIGTSSQIFRLQGITEVLFDDKNAQVSLLDAQPANWKRDQAMTITENWLTAHGGGIDAIVAQNDDMIMGALEAVEAKGLTDKIVLMGIDAIPDALVAIKDGRLNATLYQDAAGQGRGSLDVALELIKNNKVKIPDLMIPYKTVTKENADQFMY
jgi:ABC-type sugar transport system substrate-binding protein